MLETIASLATFCSLVLAAYGCGRPLLRAFRLGDQDSLPTAVWSLGLGLVAGGLLVLGLGLIGWLYPALLGVLLFAAGAWALTELARARFVRFGRQRGGARAKGQFMQSARRGLTDGYAIESKLVVPALASNDVQKRFSRVLALLAVVAAAGALVAALAPPTAGDALCYHLELPKVWLHEHAIVMLPDSDNSTFPLLVEMWYLWALALDGPVAAQLVHWGFGILLALAAAVLATPLIGKQWAGHAGCVVLLVPGITNQMTAPLNDLGLATFTTLALAAWWQASRNYQKAGWFALAGVMLGGALGTKHLALLFIAAAAAPCGWLLYRKVLHHRDEGRGTRNKGCDIHRRCSRRILLYVSTTALVAILVGSAWYVRAAWHHGNPVFPFFHEFVGGQGKPTLRDTKAAMGRRPLAILQAPWYVTMHPEALGGRGHQLGPLFLVALPGLFVCRSLPGLGLLLGIGGLYLCGWCFLRQNVRFLFPIVPLMATAVVWTWVEWRRWPCMPRIVAVWVTGAVVGLGAAASVSRARDKIDVAIGSESREQFLFRSEPTYQAAWFANAALPDGAHLLSQEHRAFYFDARLTRESLYRERTHYDRQLAQGHDLAAVLISAGFTHLLLANSVGDEGIHYDSTLSRLAQRSLAGPPDGGLNSLMTYDFRDADGAVRRYRLVALSSRHTPCAVADPILTRATH